MPKFEGIASIASAFLLNGATRGCVAWERELLGIADLKSGLFP